MKSSPRVIRNNVCAVLAALVAAAFLLGSQPVSAQPIPAFLNAQGGTALVNSNLGQSALAIQRTCGQLAGLGGFALTGSEGELFLRCNELVATANDLNGGAGFPRTLGYSNPDELLAAYQQVNGEEVLAESSLAQSGSYDQFSSIGSRLGALRGASSASVSSVASNGADFMYGSGGGAAADDMPFGPWGWFVRGSFTSGERDPSDPNGFVGAENGFEFDQVGLTVGFDHTSGSRVWGAAVGFSSYEVDMKNRSSGAQTSVVNGGSIESDSVNASFYYDYSADNNLYFSALAGFGRQSFDLARNFVYFSQNTADPTVVDQTRSLIGAPDGDSTAASLTVGRMFQRGGMVIDPRIGFTYDRVTIDRFAEVDSGNQGSGLDAMQLAFDEQKIDSMRVNIGVQISNNINTSFGSIRPTFSADLYHEFEDDARSLAVKYALEDELAGQGSFTTGFNGCVSCFTLRSDAPDSDFFVLGAGLAASFRNGLQSFVMLEGLLGYDDLDTFAITIGLRGQL